MSDNEERAGEQTGCGGARPEVTLVVTAHNMEDCLGEALASLAAQTFGDFRAIVVEDGSLDGTYAVAEAFCASDGRFSVVRTEGLGAASARNRGLEMVDSPFFMLLDGDDVFHPDLLEKLHRGIVGNDADLAVCDIVQIDHATGRREEAPWALKRGQLPAGLSAFSWRDMEGNPFAAFMGWPWDKLYRTDFARKEGLRFPEDLANSEDMLFTYKAVVLARRICVVDEVLIDHRIGRGGSVSSSRAKDPYAFYEALCRMKAFLKGLPGDCWDGLGRSYLNWAFDWTLWNIETMPDDDVRAEMARRLRDGAFAELELDKHAPAFFAGYPRSMARYASILEDDCGEPDKGPLGPIDSLPYGKFKPWSQAGVLDKLAIKWRMWRAKPVEW